MIDPVFDGCRNSAKLKTINKTQISIETTIHAPASRVWQAWTDPAMVINWFGSDPDGRGLSAKLDVRTGGSFEVIFQDSDQTQHTCSGVYSDVQELRKLSFSWRWESEPAFESFVTVLLTPAGNTTHMRFEHNHLAPRSKHDYVVGWNRTFSKLEDLLTKSGDSRKQ